jgi:hypothetical protein
MKVIRSNTELSREQLGRVSIYRVSGAIRYPTTPPYHPDQAYPEYPFAEYVCAEPNCAYEAVRGALHLLGLDAERFGTPAWNPLATLIAPDDLVVIKPNMVRDFHEFPEEGTDALITHGSIVRAVVDYVYLAKGGKGGVIIADSPQNDADWDKLWEAFAFDALLEFYQKVAPDFKIEIYDVRKEAVRKDKGVVVLRYKPSGRPTRLFGGELRGMERVRGGARTLGTALRRRIRHLRHEPPPSAGQTRILYRQHLPPRRCGHQCPKAQNSQKKRYHGLD